MAVIEAAAHGTPTVAFAVGGITDAVAKGESGEVVSPGDYDAFNIALLKTYQKRKELKQTSLAHAERFSWDNFLAQLIELLQRSERRGHQCERSHDLCSPEMFYPTKKSGKKSKKIAEGNS